MQLLNYIPSHLPNTNSFLERLRGLRCNQKCFIESFDVSALYTNVSNDNALEAIHELLVENEGNINFHGLSITQVMVLLRACLGCNVFRWSGRYFAQVRGLAMGQRLAPVLAIAFMAKIEAPLSEIPPLFYCRYIDDCLIICSTQEEVDRCFDLLNGQSEYIRFTREKPIEDWLPFLNVQVKSCEDSYLTKWYRKPSNKNILLHAISAHPNRMKKAVIRNMFRTASAVSSGPQEREESRSLARMVAVSNGYHEYNRSTPQSTWHRNVRDSRADSQDIESRIPFYVPFISDEVTTAIRQCLKRASMDKIVTVIDIPPSNLKRLLVRNRIYDRICMTPNCVICPTGKEGDCMRTGTVYLITCRRCGEEYIGESARALCVRIKEHLIGKEKSRLPTPLGSHRVRSHEGADFEIEVKILACETRTQARKTLEAFWIRARGPKMNRKDECLTITRELEPYLDQIF